MAPTIQDAKRSWLLAYLGLSTSTKTTPDLERAALLNVLGTSDVVKKSSLTDLWARYLKTQGFSGDMDSMFRNFLLAQTGKPATWTVDDLEYFFYVNVPAVIPAPPVLTAGTLSHTKPTSGSANFTWNTATGGTISFSYLMRSASSDFSNPTIVAGFPGGFGSNLYQPEAPGTEFFRVAWESSDGRIVESTIVAVTFT